MAEALPYPNPSYMAELTQVASQFLPPDQVQACRGAFEDLTMNFDLYRGQSGKVAELGASLKADFAGVNIDGCADVGMAPLVDGVTAAGPQVVGPSQVHSV
jgi:hypothetical protein